MMKPEINWIPKPSFSPSASWMVNVDSITLVARLPSFASKKPGVLMKLNNEVIMVRL